MKDKTMLIIGAGPGISLHTARKFGKAGYKIALVARSIETLQRYEEELAAQGIMAKTSVGDASQASSLRGAIDRVIGAFGRIDVLLYNAAAGTPGMPTQVEVSDLLHDFQISVGGALTSVQAVVPHMKEGAILLTGGGLALQPHASYSSLAISKAGLRSLSYSLHQELQPVGIYVGTLTVNGFVQEGSGLTANHAAEAFYRMSQERTDIEVILKAEMLEAKSLETEMLENKILETKK
ncbi:SDR family NAD(P)-dependent oxidoreductase [Marinicrinis sediminis]|uniref:SDR family NAD(P)-dependent oxidoreductase n=1 Tax=Marinicrinis sediminis TaxID=1652465 RepID=A0ABW5R757_9BACL